VVAICAATGVVGPGVGGVVGLFHSTHGVKAHPPREKRVLPLRSGPVVRQVPQHVAEPSHSGRAARKTRDSSLATQASSSRGRALGDESGTTAERTHASARSLGVESEVTPPEPAAPPAPAAPSPSSEPESNPTRESSEQFGP
jgi:hypothetical protein